MQVKKQQLEHEMEPTDWFKIGKGVCQGCILSPCLFNLYAEYIMQNAELDESQAGIKIVGRNINNLRYAENTTLMAESKEEKTSLLMKVKKESEKNWLKAQHKKNDDHGIFTSWQREWKTDTVTGFIFLVSKITVVCWLQPWN